MNEQDTLEALKDISMNGMYIVKVGFKVREGRVSDNNED